MIFKEEGIYWVGAKMQLICGFNFGFDWVQYPGVIQSFFCKQQLSSRFFEHCHRHRKRWSVAYMGNKRCQIHWTQSYGATTRGRVPTPQNATSRNGMSTLAFTLTLTLASQANSNTQASRVSISEYWNEGSKCLHHLKHLIHCISHTC